MEEQFNCNSKLTLEDRALGKVAVTVWNASDILALIEKCRFASYSEDDEFCTCREALEDKVKANVSNLELPDSLKNQMIHLVRPMCLDTLAWKMFHEQFLSDSREHFNVHILKHICRTPTGAIDYRQTAEELVLLGRFDVVSRYRLSCLYCLVDHIAVLWLYLPKSFQTRFDSEDFTLPIRQTQLEFYWPLILKGEELKLERILGVNLFQHAFEYSAVKGNKSATQYFFHKLPPEERDSALLRALTAVLNGSRNILFRSQFDFPAEKLCDVVSYLLSLLSPEQRMQALKDHPRDIFRCFLDCPWTNRFLDIVDVIWTFLPENSCGELLSLFVGNVMHTDYYSPNFFRDFFLRSPRNIKTQFVLSHNSLFHNFFNAEDTETIKVVFRNVDHESRKRLVYDINFFKLLNHLVMTGKGHLVELCLQEATLSKEEMLKLKQLFMAFLRGIDARSTRLRKRKWTIFFQYYDKNNPSSINKRSSEKEMLPRAKKPCNK